MSARFRLTEEKETSVRLTRTMINVDDLMQAKGLAPMSRSRSTKPLLTLAFPGQMTLKVQV